MDAKLKKLIDEPPSGMHKPLILRFKNAADKKYIDDLISQKSIIRVIDEWGEQENELSAVKKPSTIFTNPKQQKKLSRDSSSKGVWVYYPWHHTLVHLLEKKLFNLVRLSRNIGLISSAEQKALSVTRIGIAGLNVGNPAAICIALEGGTQMKFADNDVLTVSNLGRFRASVSDLGLNKAVVSAHQVYDINPFADISIYPNGLTPSNINEFLLSPKIDVLVEEMDNLLLKIAIREKARKQGIPVVMVTGNGAGLILDVERFDQNRRLPLLNGLLKETIIQKIKSKNFTTTKPQERLLLARDFMGAQTLTPRLRKAFKEVGKSIAGIPQIAEASFLRGAIVCFVVREIVSGKRMPSGRYHLNIADILGT